MRDFESWIFIIITISIFLENVGYSLIVPIFPLIVEDMAFDAVTTGIIFAVYPFLQLISFFPLGYIADKKGKPQPITLMIGVGLGSMALGTFLFTTPNPMVMILARRIQGFANSMIWVASFFLIGSLFPTQRGEKMGIVNAAMGFGAITGVAFGAITPENSYFTPFVMLSIAFVIVGAIIIIFTMKRTFQSTSKGSSLPLLGSIALVIKERNGLGVLLLFGLATFGLGAAISLFPIYLRDFFQLNTLEVGGVIGTALIAFSFSLPLFGFLSDKKGRKNLILIGLPGIALGMIVIVNTMNLTLVLAGMVLMGIAMSSVMSSTDPLLMDTVSYSVRKNPSNSVEGDIFGITSSLRNVSWATGMVMGPLIGGLIVQEFGEPTLGYFLAGLSILWMFLMTFLLVDVDLPQNDHWDKFY